MLQKRPILVKSTVVKELKTHPLTEAYVVLTLVELQVRLFLCLAKSFTQKEIVLHMVYIALLVGLTSGILV